jgi:hypothetical protein
MGENGDPLTKLFKQHYQMLIAPFVMALYAYRLCASFACARLARPAPMFLARLFTMCISDHRPQMLSSMRTKVEQWVIPVPVDHNLLWFLVLLAGTCLLLAGGFILNNLTYWAGFAFGGFIGMNLPLPLVGSADMEWVNTIVRILVVFGMGWLSAYCIQRFERMALRWVAGTGCWFLVNAVLNWVVEAYPQVRSVAFVFASMSNCACAHTIVFYSSLYVCMCVVVVVCMFVCMYVCVCVCVCGRA